jgi:hypothetical protein
VATVEDIVEKAALFAARRGRLVAGRLGFGIHGMVFVIEGNAESGASAVKIHENREPFLRECNVYERLAERGVLEICGFNVPQVIGWDDELLAIEMTVVKPPFVLDFAGAYLDWPPRFSEEVWEERLSKWREEFGDDWPIVQNILSELEDFGIHMLDPSPANIRFR